MFKVESIISNLNNRDLRIDKIIATFKTFQKEYKVNLFIDYFLESFVVKLVTNSYFVLSSIFFKHLNKFTKSIIVVYMHR